MSFLYNLSDHETMSHSEFFILAHLEKEYSEVHSTILMKIQELSVYFYHIIMDRFYKIEF